MLRFLGFSDIKWTTVGAFLKRTSCQDSHASKFFLAVFSSLPEWTFSSRDAPVHLTASVELHSLSMVRVADSAEFEAQSPFADEGELQRIATSRLPSDGLWRIFLMLWMVAKSCTTLDG